MDGHFFLIDASAHCPVDGSQSDAASAVLSSGHTAEGLTIATLSNAGISAGALADILIVEMTDDGNPAQVLEPR
jgi:hypothetical protein